jgi:hypothetical protein
VEESGPAGATKPCGEAFGVGAVSGTGGAGKGRSVNFSQSYQRVAGIPSGSTGIAQRPIHSAGWRLIPHSGKPWVILNRFIFFILLARKKIPEYYSCSLPKLRQRRSLVWVDVLWIVVETSRHHDRLRSFAPFSPSTAQNSGAFLVDAVFDSRKPKSGLATCFEGVSTRALREECGF